MDSEKEKGTTFSIKIPLLKLEDNLSNDILSDDELKRIVPNVCSVAEEFNRYVDALDPAADKDVLDGILRLCKELSLDFLNELISALLVH